MSRCFPFPPPGYEKKARNDHADLLTKEKHKEKRHKKEKRDKEKKEGKERKDKDRSKDKLKEKKDRKERHRDKKRDKDKDKDKSRTLDDKRIEERTAGHNEQKLDVSNQIAEEVKDSRFTEELGRRIRDDENGAANRMFDNRMFENITCSIPKRVEGLRTATAMEKERDNGNGMVTNLISKEQRRIDGIERPVEKDAVKKIEERAAKDREAGDGKGDRQKDRDREEDNNKEKGRNRHKEKEKQKGKIREKGEHKHQELDKTKDTGKKDQVDSLNLKAIGPHNAKEKCAGTDGHNKKRKDFEMNGFLHENVVQPNKLPKPASSSHLPGKNGRTLELCHVPISDSSIRHGAVNNIKAERVIDNKENKINGTAEAQPSPADLRPSVAASTSVKSEASSKPPHPDSEHLSQIYSVPKTKDTGKKDQVDSLNLKPIAPHNANGKCAGTDGHNKKRKNFEMNGFLHENDVRPNKLPRPASSSHPPGENGRTSEFCNVPICHSSIRHGAMNNIKAEKVLATKEHKINGNAEAQPSPADSRPSVAAGTSVKSEASSKSPHPDSEHLSQMYSVPKTKDTGKKDQVDGLNLKPIAPRNANEKCAGTDGQNKKRKDFEMNGFLHENDVRPNKLRRPSSSHPPGENGRTLEFCNVPVSESSIRHGTMNNIKAERVLDTKEHKINGTEEAHPSPADSLKGEASLKPPHPDSEHLSQIYSVPKMEEWPESDDQEWLFSGSNSQPKPKARLEAGEAPQVWAKGLQIESADVFALPYVIPY